MITFLHTALTRAQNGDGTHYIRYRGGREPSDHDMPTALVLVPKAVVTQWVAEVKKWLGTVPETLLPPIRLRFASD